MQKKRKHWSIGDIPKLISPSRYMPIPPLGVVTVWWDGGKALRVHIHHHECTCGAEAFKIDRKDLEKLLQGTSIEVARVEFATDQGTFVRHYLGNGYERDVRRAKAAGVSVEVKMLPMPTKLFSRLVKQLD